MKKFTCPYCYEKHTDENCFFKCSYNIVGVKKECKYDFPKNSDGTIDHKYIKKCLKCDSAKLSRFCPNNKNGRLWEIPDRACNDNFSIALIGAKSSGKTNYIAVLINEIKKKMAKSFDCSLIMINQRTVDNYKTIYYKPLYENSTVVQVTDSGETEPLICAIDFFETKKNKSKVKDSITLSLYDTAGENFDREDTMLCNTQYIANAQGIIVLLDPLQIPSIRDQLQNKITLPPKNTDTPDILSLVINNIRDRKKITGTIDIPVALAFTKIDLLLKYNIIPEDSCLQMESEHVATGAFVKSDFENTNIEMTDLLENMLDDELTQLLKTFSKYSFFGVSALGENPNGASLNGQPKPIRVLDPLLWLLSLEKKIKSVN